jgi:hypothetical protein
MVGGKSAACDGAGDEHGQLPLAGRSASRASRRTVWVIEARTGDGMVVSEVWKDNMNAR